MKMTKELAKEILNSIDFTKDQGKEPASRTFTDDERKLIAFSQAVNLSLIQLSLEGVFDPAEHMHFMVHLNDFANRLYERETVSLPSPTRPVHKKDGEDTVDQSFSTDSKSGELYLIAAEYGLQNGKEEQQRGREEVTRFMETQAPITDDPDFELTDEQKGRYVGQAQNGKRTVN